MSTLKGELGDGPAPLDALLHTRLDLPQEQIEQVTSVVAQH